ncbi:MAG TPA: hypothetical protein VMZ29_00050 [Candidatus Bathyarchaeia archaeon]|nr:hypothetical protein [Candidatus Bathyarchaeia archaeon]
MERHKVVRCSNQLKEQKLKSIITEQEKYGYEVVGLAEDANTYTIIFKTLRSSGR